MRLNVANVAQSGACLWAVNRPLGRPAGAWRLSGLTDANTADGVIVPAGGRRRRANALR